MPDPHLPSVLVLVGPTASGKTAISLELARVLGGEIISADSRQIYKYLDIGTGKPALDACSRVRHYFVGELLPDQDFNAGEFGSQGRAVIKDILQRGKTPMVVGGSGLYVQSLVDGLFEGPGADREYREHLHARIRAGEIAQLLEELRRVDPVSASRADPTKPRRIVRALEVYHLTGRPMTDQQKAGMIAIEFTPVLFGLEWDRSVLYRRIDDRCRAMVEAGLLREVERLERRGYTRALNALNTVGYKEAFAYRNGEISYAEMMRLFRQNSRRYAKRQMTWFRRDRRIRWIQMDERQSPQQVAERIVSEFQAAKGRNA